MSERMVVDNAYEPRTAAQQAQSFMQEFNYVYGADELAVSEKITRLNDLAHRQTSFADNDPLAYATHMLSVASRQMDSGAAGYVKNLSRSVVVQVVENGTSIDDLVRFADSSRRQTQNPEAALLASQIIEASTAIKRDLGEKRSAERKAGRDATVDAMKAGITAVSHKAAEVTKSISHDLPSLPIVPAVRVTVAGTALAAIAAGMTFTQAAAASELPTSIPVGMQAGSVHEVQATDDDVIGIPGAHFDEPEVRTKTANPGEVEPQAPISDDDDSIELPPGVSAEPPVATPEPKPKDDDVIPLPPGAEIVLPQQPELKDDETIPLPPGAEIVPPAPEPSPKPSPTPAPGETPPEMPIIPPTKPVDPPKEPAPSAPGEQSPDQKTPEQINQEVQKARDKAFLREIESYVDRAAQSSKHGKPINAKKLYDLLNKYHDKNKHAVIDREFIMSAIWQESTFKPNAVSSVGAQGLGQFMPGTAKEMGLDDPFDPEESVRAAYEYYIKIYKIMEDRFPDKSKADLTDMTLAGYNAGPYHKRLIEGGLPQNDQTQGYIRIINGLIAHVDKAEAKAEKKVRAKYDDAGDVGPKRSPGDSDDDSDKEKPKKPMIVGWGEGAGGEHELEYFNQRDPKWAGKPYRKNNSPESSGTIELCGCGPSSLAMSIATMTGKKTDPVKMSEWFMNHGGPVSSSNCASNWIWESRAGNFENDFGVKIKRIKGTDAAIKKAIDKGGMVIMSQGPGMFTSGGHIMTVTGYVKSPNKDGGNHKYLVGDSNSTRKTADLEGYSPSVMIGNGSPVSGVGLGGAGASRGYLKAAWSITPIKSEIKSTSSAAPSPFDVDVAPISQLEVNPQDLVIDQDQWTPSESAPDLLDMLNGEEVRAEEERARIEQDLFGTKPELSKGSEPAQVSGADSREARGETGGVMNVEVHGPRQDAGAEGLLEISHDEPRAGDATVGAETLDDAEIQRYIDQLLEVDDAKEAELQKYVSQLTADSR